MLNAQVTSCFTAKETLSTKACFMCSDVKPVSCNINDLHSSHRLFMRFVDRPVDLDERRGTRLGVWMGARSRTIEHNVISDDSSHVRTNSGRLSADDVSVSYMCIGGRSPRSPRRAGKKSGQLWGFSWGPFRVYRFKMSAFREGRMSSASWCWSAGDYTRKTSAY